MGSAHLLGALRVSRRPWLGDTVASDFFVTTQQIKPGLPVLLLPLILLPLPIKPSCHCICPVEAFSSAVGHCLLIPPLPSFPSELQPNSTRKPSVAPLGPQDDVQSPACGIQVHCERHQRASHPFLTPGAPSPSSAR